MNLCIQTYPQTYSPPVTASMQGTRALLEEAPISKTMRYKKITKPLLERKRRARINACLDELKDIMTVALQAEGENVSKLEKADILELTVRHLHKLNQSQRLTIRNPLDELQKFQAGYSSCAQEAATFLLSTPGLDVRVGQRLLGHLFSPGQSIPPPFVRFPQVHSQHVFPPHPSATSIPVSDVEPILQETKPLLTETKPHLTEIKPHLTEIKTVPVKPAAMRLTVHANSFDAVWKPYS